LHVNARGLIEHQSKRCVGHGLKSLSSYLYRILANRYAQDVVCAGVICFRRPRCATLGVGCGHAGAIDGRPAGISNTPDDRCGYFLAAGGLPRNHEAKQY
jgi:hypothetical protein